MNSEILNVVKPESGNPKDFHFVFVRYKEYVICLYMFQDYDFINTHIKLVQDSDINLSYNECFSRFCFLSRKNEYPTIQANFENYCITTYENGNLFNPIFTPIFDIQEGLTIENMATYEVYQTPEPNRIVRIFDEDLVLLEKIEYKDHKIITQ